MKEALGGRSLGDELSADGGRKPRADRCDVKLWFGELS